MKKILNTNNPTALRSPLARGNLENSLGMWKVESKNSPLTREYPRSGGGLLSPNQDILQTKEEVL